MIIGRASNYTTATAGSFDASGLISKGGWEAIYKSIALRTLNSVKGEVEIKYEWNKSSVWYNY